MTKRKEFDWKKWFLVGGVPAVLTAIVLAAKTITTYAELPAEVKETKEDVADIKEYIKIQQKANELLQEQIDNQKEPILSPDGKYYLDEETGKWKAVKHGR